LKLAGAVTVVLSLVTAHAAQAPQAGGTGPLAERNAAPATSAAGGPQIQADGHPRTDQHGDPLPAGARARLGTVRFRGADALHYLAYSPDGKLLASGGADGPRVWDAATGREVRRFPADEGREPYGEVAFSADSKLLAVGGYHQHGPGGAVYEVATGCRLYRFGKPGHYTEACFSADGRKLAVTYGFDDPAIDLCDAVTGAPLRALAGHQKRPGLTIQQASVMFSPGGKVLVSAGADGTIRFWNLASGRELRRLSIAPRYIDHVALSPDGSRLAATDLTKIGERAGQTFWDHRVQVWTVHIRNEAVLIDKRVRRLVVPALPIEEGRQFDPASLAFTPDGKALVMGGWDRTVRMLDVATGKETHRFADYSGGASALAVAPGGKTFAIVDPIQSIRLCDLTAGRDVVRLTGHGDLLSAVGVSPDGRTVATASRDATIRLWDARTGRQLRLLATDQPHLRRRLLFSPDGQTLFVAGGDETVRVWDLAKYRERGSVKWHPSGWDLLALSPDGKTLVSEAPGNSLTVMEVATGKDRSTLHGPTQTIAVVGFTADGRTVLAWSFDDHLHSWDLATGRHQRRRCDLRDAEGGGTGVRAVAFTPDGRLLALGGSSRIAVFVVATGREICRFAHGNGGRDDSVQFLAFAPDGRTLAWGVAGDNVIRLGEVLTGKERHRLVGHRGRVERAAFAHDGSVLVSASDDTTALVWDMTGPPPGGTAPVAHPGAQRLAAWWAGLADADARKAYRAIGGLTARPEEAVPFLKDHLRPVAVPDGQRLARLIADLDSGRFAVRERAARELEELGELAEPVLNKALAGKPSPEVRRRAAALLAKLGGPVRSPATLQALRAVEVLEHVGTPAAVVVLKALAQGAPAARLTQDANAALERLARRVAS
jgi:WD40 repeat protein